MILLFVRLIETIKQNGKPILWANPFYQLKLILLNSINQNQADSKKSDSRRREQQTKYISNIWQRSI